MARRPKPLTREQQPKYTGVGSRSTPDDVLELMTALAVDLRAIGYTLRSGGAEGADTAFGAGAKHQAHIFLPWANFGTVEPGALAITFAQAIDPDVTAIARGVHPAWNNLTDGPRKLHARNVRQVLGVSLKEPSDFLLCWTPEGRDLGGTATAIRLAHQRAVPVYNLGHDDVLDKFQTLGIRAITPALTVPTTLPSDLPF